jgi:hypothetical protein
MLQLTKIKVDELDANAIPGYRRGAYATLDSFGCRVRNVDTMMRPCFIVHQNKDNRQDVLVEVCAQKVMDGGVLELRRISPAKMLKFVEGVSDAPRVVVLDGRAFLAGIDYDPRLYDTVPSVNMDLCHMTNAMKFIVKHMNAFAAAIYVSDRNLTADEAHDVVVFLSDVAAFLDEVDHPKDGIMGGREKLMDQIHWYKYRIAKIDETAAYWHEMYNNSLEVLASLGIEFREENEKKG